MRRLDLQVPGVTMLPSQCKLEIAPKTVRLLVLTALYDLEF
jgi:hypothetical protein